MANGETIESYVPARLDRMPWNRWHWLIVVSLGATWILDGLEVTLAGALGGILTRPETLGLTTTQVGASATCYLAGAVVGAVLFGYGTDRFGRKKLFFITVAVYLLGTALSAFSWNFWSYTLFRALTGAGIGGEYAAINSAIDELIPARVRGRVDLMINGSYWVGAALGATGMLFLLNPDLFPIWLGWRCAFGIGAFLGLIVIFFRRWIPESPRWLLIHGRPVEAERILDEVDHMLIETLEGQANELGWVRDNDLGVGADDYMRLVLKKTAWYSFIHPMRIGALVADPNDANLDRFDAFGFLLGLAFQVTDDVLNLTGDMQRYGKEVDGDLWEGKRTLLLTHALRHAASADRDWIGAFLARPREQRLPREVFRLRRIVEDTGSLRWAQESADYFARAAELQFDSAAFRGVQPGPDLDWLRQCVPFLVRRDR